MQNKLEFEGSWVAIALFGLPFLFIGLSLIYVAILVEPKGDSLPGIIVMPFAIICTLLGTFCVFLRSTRVLDKDKGLYIIHWSCLGWSSTEEKSIDGVDLVTLSKEVRGSGKNRRTVHPVQIVAKAKGGEAIEIDSFENEFEGRSLAEQIGKFLHIAMSDTSSVQEVYREAGTLDYSIKDRFVEKGIVPKKPTKPRLCRCECKGEGKSLQVHIPPTGFQDNHKTQLLYAFLLALIVGAIVVPIAIRDEVWILIVILGFVAAIPIGTMVGLAIRAAYTSYDVEVDERLLSVVSKGLFNTTKEEIPANELEELFVGFPPLKPSQAVLFASKCLMARSDKTSISFGWGLDDDELNYVKGIIEYALCG